MLNNRTIVLLPCGLGDRGNVYKNKLLKQGQCKALFTWHSKLKGLILPEE